MKSFKHYITEVENWDQQMAGDDEGNQYRVKDLYDYGKKHGRSEKISIDDTDGMEWWHKKYSMDDKDHLKRMMNADTSVPVLAVEYKPGKYSIADGLNRVKKAHSVEGKKDIPAVIIHQDDMKKAGKKEVTEAAKRSLSRLHTHIGAGHMVGFVSASRGNLSPAENNRRTKQLKKSLIQHGYAPIAVKGEYIEDHNGERRPVKEKSFMVHSGSLMAGHKEWNPSSLHSEFLNDMKKHGEMYGQDTVLTVSQKHGSVFHGTGESTWVPKGKRSRIGGAGLKSGPEIEAGDFKSRLAGKPFIVGGETVREGADLEREGFTRNEGMPKKAARKLAYAMKKGNYSNALSRYTKKTGSMTRRVGEKLDSAVRAVTETIAKEGDEWVVRGKKGGESEKKVFGKHSSRKKAMKQLAAIEISKARRGK